MKHFNKTMFLKNDNDKQRPDYNALRHVNTQI